MTSSLGIALQITLIGMGLVFIAILLLAFVIYLLVRFTSRPGVFEAEIPPESGEARSKERAAAAAVAVALLKTEQPGIHEFPLPPTALVSAWQAVMRSDMLKKRGRIR